MTEKVLVVLIFPKTNFICILFIVEKMRMGREMKSIDEMTGIEKAAALLVAMGRDVASEVFKYLDESSIMRLSAEIAKIDRLSSRDKEDLIGEFIIRVRKMRHEVSGGESFARKILNDAFGDERASMILEKVNQIPQKDAFEFLSEADPATIVDMVRSEHPQMIAVMIAHIDKSKAGAVMKLLPRDSAADVAVRLARMGKVSPEAIKHAAISLKKKYDTVNSKKQIDTAGGINALAGIMNHLDPDAGKRLMDSLDSDMPEFADEVRRKITVYEFESIIILSNKEIRLVLEQVKENRIIAKALKGATDDLKYRILRNMSTNRANDIISLMDLMGPMRLSEVTESRTHIVTVMRELSEKGKILLRKEGEDLVE